MPHTTDCYVGVGCTYTTHFSQINVCYLTAWMIKKNPAIDFY